MRIMFVIGTMGRGGAEVQVKDLALRLVSRGHQVAVVVMIPFLDFEADLRGGGVETLSLGMTRGTASLRALVTFIAFARRFRPDVVHAHMFAGIMLARVTRALLIARGLTWNALISTSHSGREVSRGRYLTYHVTSWLSDQWTSVSRAGLATHAARGALGHQPAMYLPNGIDLARFRRAPSSRAEARAALAIDGEFVWLAIGSFRDDDKDYATMLRAFASGTRRGSSSLLLIAGDGRLMNESMALARSLGVTDRVHFLGMRSDIIQLLHAADAFVLSSRAEAMPMVLLEAAACSLPIVATNVGDCAEIVGDDEGGVVVPASSPASLAKAMDQLEAMNVEQRSEMGEAGRDRVATRFALDVLVERWEALYVRLSGAAPADSSSPAPKGEPDVRPSRSEELTVALPPTTTGRPTPLGPD